MVAKELPSGCGVCGKKEGLLRCSGCKVLSYCGRDHQVADRQDHKYACTAIRKARVKMENEEQTLRDHPGDVMMEPDPFTNSVGHFWGVFDTRDYMRARFALVEAMVEVDSVQSVEAQLDHLMDLLRLCRSDNMGVRDIVPGLLLRLNKDQECYDFIKWWTVPVEQFCVRFADLSHLSCLCLLKIKLLFEIMRLEQSTASLGPAVPREILDLIQSSIPQSPAVGASHDIMSGDSDVRKTVIKKLNAQVDVLFEAVEKANGHFWPALIDPDTDLSEMPSAYSKGSPEEMLLVLRYNYEAWIETPGAFNFILKKLGDRIK